MQRLNSVPVFTITDAEGAPLVASPSEGEQGAPVAEVFISRQDAENFLNNLRNDNPELANNVQVVPVSLAEVYNLALEAEAQEDPLEFAFVPMRQQVDSALSVLRQSGENVEEFPGVPLFLARSANEGEGDGYLTIQQGEQQVIPIFFKQEDLQAMLTRLSTSQPDLAETITVQVINLEELINTLQASDNPALNQIQLIPPRESIDYIRSLQPTQGQQPAQPQAQPQPSPSPGQ
jgi:nickel transport protein